MSETIKVFCSICGVPVRVFDKRNKKPPWLQEGRLVSRSDALRNAAISVMPLRIGLFDVEDLVAEILDPSDGKYRPSEATVFRDKHRDDGISNYPMHSSCWAILEVYLGNNTHIDFSARLASLYTILDNTSYWELQFGFRLRWPHRYYGIDKYIHRPASSGWKVPLEFPFVHDDPLALPEDVFLGLTNLEDDSSLSVPHFLPLPPEIVDRVYSFLHWSDVLNLGQIRSTAPVAKIPDIYWQRLLAVDGELGYLCLGREQEFHKKVSWYQLFEIAVAECQSTGRLQNRFRVAKICRELSDLVKDRAASQSFGLDALSPAEEIEKMRHPLIEEHSDYPSLSVNAESYKGDLGTRRALTYDGTMAIFEAKTDFANAEQVIVYYAGSGSLQFVSGVVLLPADERIGYLTNVMRVLETRDKVVMSVAISKYGVVDISFSDSLDHPQWREGNFADRVGRVAVKRRVLCSREFCSLKIRLSAKFDAAKMTALSIETSRDDAGTSRGGDAGTDIAGIDQRELFIEKHAWIPYPPPQDLELNISSYRGRSYVYWWNQKFRPMEQVIFPDRVYRITGWALGHNNFLSGITFHFGDASTPSSLTLGHQLGAAIDFFVNASAGEYITQVFGLYNKSEFEAHNGRLSGLRIRTNFERVGLFSVNLPDCEEEEFCIPPGHIVAGFYATSVQDRNEPLLTSLGLISRLTTGIGDAKASSFPPPSVLKTVDTATHVHRLSLKMHDRISIGPIGQYCSKASFLSCNRIVCYIRRALGVRVAGLTLEYVDTTTTATFGNPRILGQVSNAVPSDEVLVLEAEEELVSVEVFKQLSHSWNWVYSVRGLRMTTSTGRSVFWGTRTDDHGLDTESSKLDLKPDSILRWDFNEYYDILKLEDNT